MEKVGISLKVIGLGLISFGFAELADQYHSAVSMWFFIASVFTGMICAALLFIEVSR